MVDGAAARLHVLHTVFGGCGVHRPCAWDGGGVYASGGAAVWIENSSFHRCSAAWYGGAVYAKDVSTVVHVRGTVFENNTAAGGAAVRVYSHATVMLDGGDNVFVGNRAGPAKPDAGAVGDVFLGHGFIPTTGAAKTDPRLSRVDSLSEVTIRAVGEREGRAASYYLAGSAIGTPLPARSTVEYSAESTASSAFYILCGTGTQMVKVRLQLIEGQVHVSAVEARYNNNAGAAFDTDAQVLAAWESGLSLIHI